VFSWGGRFGRGDVLTGNPPIVAVCVETAVVRVVCALQTDSLIDSDPQSSETSDHANSSIFIFFKYQAHK